MEFENIGWRVQELATSIPGYIGYSQRERRREADKRLRMELARRYDEQRGRLGDLQAQLVREGQLEALDDLERAVMKLQRFIDRLRTASYGYAGWFDAPTIQEEELDQLYTFDQSLAEGVGQVAQGIDGLASALEKGKEIGEVLSRLTATLDGLNTRFDQRRELLSRGKKLPPTDLLKVLEPPPPPSPAEGPMAALRPKDALTYAGTDYLIIGKITYAAREGRWYAYLLQDEGPRRWLRVGDRELAIYDEVNLPLTTPPFDRLRTAPPETIEVEGESFEQVGHSSATATVEGPTGRRRGRVESWRYASASGEWLLVERWGEEVRVSRGQAIDAEELQLWPRKK
ncbi:MAG: DUF4178 domain-containing protein [Anaerolineae bacterium]